MDSIKLSFMEKNDIQESARVLSVAMLNNPLHVAVRPKGAKNLKDGLNTSPALKRHSGIWSEKVTALVQQHHHMPNQPNNLYIYQ